LSGTGYRQEAAKELRDEAQKLIQRMQRQTEDATKKSEKSMQVMGWDGKSDRDPGNDGDI
jgi:hypothetical protein